MIRLKSTDPKSEVYDLVKANNPLLTNNNTMYVRKIVDNPTGKNTTLSFILDGEQKLIGISTISYDRVDIGKIFNNFVGVSKTPSIVIFGTAGSTISLSSILDQLNAKLGTAFIMTGDYADLKEQTITIPDKSGSIDIDVLAQSTANSFPSSLRVKPGTSMKIRISNSGKRISDIAVVRGMNPLLKADNNLNTSTFTMAKTTVKKFAPFDIRMVDFSMILGDATNIFDLVYVTYGTNTSVAYSIYNAYLNTATFTAINAKLTELGLPILVKRPMLPGDSPSKFTTVPNAIAIPTASVSAATKAARCISLYVKTTASLATNPLIDTSFTHVLILSKAAYAMVDSTDVMTGDYYLHFNL